MSSRSVSSASNRLPIHPSILVVFGPTGDLMARATNDLLNVRMVAGPALMYLVDTITRTLFVVPYMVIISPRLTLLSLLPLIALPPIFATADVTRSLRASLPSPTATCTWATPSRSC